MLSHAYLFKLDEELESATNGDFVRWMDDIDAGVNSREEGKRLLRNLDNVLSSQGLRLNTSKSKILSAQDAVAHFWIQENRALTIIENSIKYGSGSQPTREKQEKLLKKRFRSFKRREKVGQWDKVFKRYFKLLGMVKKPYLEKNIPSILADSPSLRPPAFTYLVRLGISAKRISLIEDFLLSEHCQDDVSLFEAIKCLITWEAPATGQRVQRMIALARNIAKKNGSYSSSGVIAAIWLLAKYGSRADLWFVIDSSKNVWEKSVWTARQVAAVTPLLAEKERLTITEIVTRNGLLQALEVLAHISRLKELTRLDNQLKSYLKHQPSQSWPYYSLQKVILTIALLQGKLDPAQKATLSDNLLTMLTDRRYKYLISQYI